MLKKLGVTLVVIGFVGCFIVFKIESHMGWGRMMNKDAKVQMMMDVMKKHGVTMKDEDMKSMMDEMMTKGPKPDGMMK